MDKILKLKHLLKKTETILNFETHKLFNEI